MANVVLTRTQFWSMIALGAITLIYLVYSSFDFAGQEDRAIIKRDIGRVLGNIIDVDRQQTQTLQELRQAEADREIRSNASTIRLNNITLETLETQRTIVPLYFRQFNQTDALVNATNDLKVIIPEAANAINNVTEAVNFLAENFGPDTGYLERENFQYEQANETAAAMREVLNLLNGTR